MYRIFILQAGSRLSCYGKLLISPSFSYSCTMRRSRRCICASIFCSKNAAGPRSLMISHLSSMKPPSTSNFLPFADANSWGNHGISTVGICGPYGETWRFGTLNARLLQLTKASSAKMNCQTQQVWFTTRKERIFHRHPTISVKQMVENPLSRRLRSPSWLALAHLAWKG